jgi:hypothetical protein
MARGGFWQPMITRVDHRRKPATRGQSKGDKYMLATGCPQSLARSRKSVRTPGVSPGYFRRQGSWPPSLSRLLAQRRGAAQGIGVPGARLLGLSFISWPEQRRGSAEGTTASSSEGLLEAKQRD